MPICVTCGNNYDRTFQVIHKEKTYIFDSFECAIHALAPVCAHCGIRVIGHGIEDGETIFCCTSCERMGVKEPRV